MIRLLPILLLLPHLASSMPQLAVQPPFTFTFGGRNATILSDGPLVFVNSPFQNIPFSAVRRAYTENFQPSNPILLEQNILIIDLPVGRAIIDAGSLNIPGPTPLFRSAGLLLRNLQIAGIAPESIDFVLLSHAHLDHVGALTTADNAMAFPKATVFVNRRDHEFWTADELNLTNPITPVATANLIRQVYLNRIAPYQAMNRVRLLEDFESPIEGVRFVPTNGHSPGHSTIEITIGGERLVCIGDTWASKADQVQNPEWLPFIDTNPEEGLESRLRQLREAANSRDLVLAYHEPFPGLGHVKRVGAFFDWVAVGAHELASRELRRLERVE